MATITDEQIAEWRTMRKKGMVSAIGEYTPDEFWAALDEIERLRGKKEKDIDCFIRVNPQGDKAMAAGYCMTNEELQNSIIETNEMIKNQLTPDDIFKILTKHLEKLLEIQAARAAIVNLGEVGI
jgi:hypothetical protein